MTSEQENQNSKSALNRFVAGKATPHKNIDQEVIVASEDKVRLYLEDYQKALTSRRDWIAPLTTGASLLMATISVDSFKNKFGFSPDTWTAMVNISLGLSIIWLLIASLNICRNWRKGSTEMLISRLRGSGSDLEAKGGVRFAGALIAWVRKKVSEFLGGGDRDE